ncbi:MAG: hypothetical protein DMF69_01925 [Acidobacteria bacterium]|nr:MAG: hypothetical protein DMF69_01925 [Acidobacteriota bacterium]
MRVIFSLLILCSLWITPLLAQTKTDRDRAELVGPVKKVEAYLVDFSIKDGSTVEGKRRPWYSTTYNNEGNISEKISYDQTGAILEKLIHTYDGKGRSTGYEEYASMLDKSLTIPRRHVYNLDEEGRKVEYIVFESKGTVGTRFIYKYDPKGNLIEEHWYGYTGVLGGKTVNTFDENGKQTAQASYSGDGTLNWKTISKYDFQGNRTEWIQYEGEILRYKVTSSYDSKGRIQENETVEFNGNPNVRASHAPEPGKVVYTYDDGKRTKDVATYGVDGTLKNRLVYTYDERGNEIGRTEFSGDGSPKNFEIQFFDNVNDPGSALRGIVSGRALMNIEYDSKGNWTRKTRLIQSEKGGPPQAYHSELRVITYY